MDKNNDIQINNVDRWNKYMVDISLWQVKDRVDNLVNNYGPQLSIGVIDAINDIYKALDEALDRFDELENKCKTKDDALQNMIREVAELEKEKIDLEVQLAQSDELRYRAAKYAWAIKTVLKKASFSPGHVAEELRFMARKSTTPKDVQERWETYADEFLGEHSKLVDKINQLEKKNDELKKENNNLTTDTKRLGDAVAAWFNMFNDMRHKRDFLKKEYEKLKETNKSLSCPVACECENFKPKVHCSYDPLDDFPDVEHS